MAQLRTNLEVEEVPQKNKVVNVSSVPQRSPFRYPGGKTWLVPTVRKWFAQASPIPTLIEPFAGGGIVSLTAGFENAAGRIIMAELDPEVAAVWEAIMGEDNHWLAERILNFELTAANVNREFGRENRSARELAFCTILKNRTFHGGIITKGSGFLKHGENGKGILSRWYPQTLYDRIRAIDGVKEKFDFRFADAFALIEQHAEDPEAYFFIDPPYTKAGKRLYSLYDIDHGKLFDTIAQVSGKFLLTYDDTPEIRQYADDHGFLYESIPMHTTHHLEKHELLITDNLDWITGDAR